MKFKPLKKNDIVLDIASNDRTLLKNYNKFNQGWSGSSNKKYRKNYKKMRSFETFFKNFLETLKKVQIITTIAVFYDVNNLRKFVSDISDILDPTRSGY